MARLRLIQNGTSRHVKLLALTDGFTKNRIVTIRDKLSGTRDCPSELAMGSGEGSPTPQAIGSRVVRDESGTITFLNEIQLTAKQSREKLTRMLYPPPSRGEEDF